MALETFYAQVDGNLEDVRKRLLTDERVEKFVRIFAADETYASLERAFAEGQAETAFRAAHTLKGMGRDLGFTEFSERASALTEALRADDDGAFGSLDEAADFQRQVKAAYGTIMDALPLLDA